MFESTRTLKCAALLAIVSVMGACAHSGGSADAEKPESSSADGSSAPVTLPTEDASPGEADVETPLGKVCGARAGDTCGETEYCAYEAGQYCGAADASATCKPRPQMCTRDYRPVCACDNKTYGNACSAAAAGQGVLTLGECPPSPDEIPGE